MKVKTKIELELTTEVDDDLIYNYDKQSKHIDYVIQSFFTPSNDTLRSAEFEVVEN